jgi:hypothetical protein
MAASEGALGELHDKVATTLSKMLDGKVLPAVTDEDGNVLQEEVVMEPSAAVLTASIQFLKNNNITCAPGENNALGELEAKMRKRQEQRANKGQPNVIDFEAAREDANFLSGRLTGS